MQNHIYAFNNEALITRELNNAKGREITDPVKKREIMKYATNFPKEGKWQSNPIAVYFCVFGHNDNLDSLYLL